MIDVFEIEPGCQIFGCDGVLVGSVASVERDLIKLASGDEDALLDYRPSHFIPLSLIDHVDNGIVWLRTKAAEVVSFEKDATSYDQRGS